MVIVVLVLLHNENRPSINNIKFAAQKLDVMSTSLHELAQSSMVDTAGVSAPSLRAVNNAPTTVWAYQYAHLGSPYGSIGDASKITVKLSGDFNDQYHELPAVPLVVDPYMPFVSLPWTLVCVERVLTIDLEYAV